MRGRPIKFGRPRIAHNHANNELAPPRDTFRIFSEVVFPCAKRALDLPFLLVHNRRFQSATT